MDSDSVADSAAIAVARNEIENQSNNIQQKHHENRNRLIDKSVGFISGLASGVTKLIIGHPFDTIKVRLQTQGPSGPFKSTLDCLLSTIRAEGPRALYKGATPPLFGWAIMDSVQMGTLTNLRLWLLEHNKKVYPLDESGNPEPLGLCQHSIAGLGAGWTVSLVASPIEIIKAKLQIQYNGKVVGGVREKLRGPVDMAIELAKQDGVWGKFDELMKGLYRGFTGTLLFRSFFCVLWGSYYLYNNWLQHFEMQPSLIPFLAGGFAANTFWTIAFPFDVVKNRLMTRDVHDVRYTNASGCIRYIYKTDGWRGFYRGFVPCILRSFPTNASAIFVFETFFKLGQELKK